MGGLGLSVIWKKMMDKAKWAQVIEDNEPPPSGEAPACAIPWEARQIAPLGQRAAA